MQLRCSHLGLSFPSDGREVSALRDVNFEVRSGEFIAVIGPSGCGKTTLLRALAGLLKPSEGRIEFGPSQVDGKRRVSLVFQEEGLFPWMNVLDNAAFGLEMQGVPRADRENRAVELLQRYGLAGRERAYPHQLSVGMKQRVSVIRSFLSDPAVLLMDEPFAALDAQTRLTLQQELLSLWENHKKTVVFITHDVDEAILLSDRVLVMSPQPGTITGEFTVPFDRPRSPESTLSEEFLVLKKRLLGMLGLASRQAGSIG
jgi:NitT/TauT family transport system ATP-binding protein